MGTDCGEVIIVIMLIKMVNGHDECHGGDDLACFECATVSDKTSLDLPQKGHFTFFFTQEENSQRAYLSLFS